MSDVFISYARSTATQAQRIAEALRALGYNVWRDDDLPAHRPYADVIDERLRGARAVVVVWSAEAAKSQWVRAEADLARNMGTLVQLRIDDTIPPLPFNQIECADLSKWKGDRQAPGWRKIVGSIADLTGAPAPTAKAPTRAAAASSRRLTPKRIAVAAGVLALVLALAAVAVWRLTPQGPAAPPGQNGRIDVVAFTPQGADPAVAKVAEETQSELVRILSGAGAQVSAVPLGPDAVGDAELRVTGALSREANTFVTSAQVLDRKSGVVLWTDRIVRQIRKDGTADNAADTIAGVLHCAMEDRKPARPPLTTEIFGLYINACASVYMDDDDDGGRMLQLSRRLAKVAPRFAGGHAMHALAAAQSANLVENSPSEAAALHAELKAAAAQAIKIDPRTPKAYAALAINEGVYGTRLAQNWLAEDQNLTKALALDPDLPVARIMYSGLLRATGRLKDAIEFLKETNGSADPRAFRIDPRLPMMLAAKGDLAGAEALLQRTEGAARGSQDAARWLIAFWWEDPKAALPKIRSLDSGGVSQNAPGCFETYLKALAARPSQGPRGLPASCDKIDLAWRIRMLAREGDVDGAYSLIKPPLPGGPILLYFPEMKSVRRDPRFWPLVKQMGLVDYWVKSNHWPDFCSEPDLPYDCRKIARAL